MVVRIYNPLYNVNTTFDKRAKKMQFLTLEEIRAHLQDRALYKVSAATGLHVHTIRNIRDGKNKNPTYAVLIKLTTYFAG